MLFVDHAGDLCSGAGRFHCARSHLLCRLRFGYIGWNCCIGRAAGRDAGAGVDDVAADRVRWAAPYGWWAIRRGVRGAGRFPSERRCAPLASVPFTPGFLAQPALARLLTSGPAYWPTFSLCAGAGDVDRFGAAQLERRTQSIHRPARRAFLLLKLLTACLLLGLPLAVAGFLPRFAETLVGIPNTIADSLGNPPNVVANAEVWVTLALPLLLGFGLVWLHPRVWPRLGDLPDRISRFSQLEWLFNLTVWGIDYSTFRSASMGYAWSKAPAMSGGRSPSCCWDCYWCADGIFSVLRNWSVVGKWAGHSVAVGADGEHCAVLGLALGAVPRP